MISCHTLGPVEVKVDGAPAPPELLWRKNLALLLYLARSPARRRTRDHIIGLLWGDKDESAARHSLREAVRVLRRCVGEEAVSTEGDQIGLLESAVSTDTEQLEQLSAKGDWSAAAGLVTGEFLEGFSVPDASPFEDWLATERSLWRQRSIGALLHHAEARLAAADLAAAEAAARRGLALDPSSERALRVAMRTLALSGDRSVALELFTRFSAGARASGGAPDAETEALARRVRAGRDWRLPDYARTAGSGAASRRSPLFGREEALAAVLKQWVSARNGRLGIVVIEGEPGSGKTRLIEEVAARAALDGGICASTRAVPADLEQPHGAIRGLLRGGLLEAAGIAGAHQSALSTIGTYVSEWAERFRTGARDSTPWSLPRAVTDVLRVASVEQPLLLVIDDGQWLDENSYRAIETMSRDLAGTAIMIVLSTAREPPNPRLEELRARVGRDVPGETVTLSTLGPDAVRALARWAFPAYSDEALDRVTRRIAVDSAGLPLLAVEICHAIALGLDLNETAGAWPEPRRTLDHTLPGALPDTVVAAIRVGFRRLSREAQTALTAAAILGEPVTGSAIGAVTSLTGDTLHGALDELEWQRWLAGDARGYCFVARIVREVVNRDMVTAGQRQRVLEAAMPAQRNL